MREEFVEQINLDNADYRWRMNSMGSQEIESLLQMNWIDWVISILRVRFDIHKDQSHHHLMISNVWEYNRVHDVRNISTIEVYHNTKEYEKNRFEKIYTTISFPENRNGQRKNESMHLECIH